MTAEERKEYYKQYYQANKKATSEHMKQYYEDNKEVLRERVKQYQKANKEAVTERRKQYRKANKEYRNQYRNNRFKTDISFKLLCSCRARLRKAIKGSNKSASTKKLLGCTIEYLKQHLEKQFTERMTFENYGKWHIDHIIPCSSFNMENEEEQRQCFHYTNLQPLWAEDNLRKSNKIGEQNERV